MKMTALMTIVFMVVIGAAIGGVTNHLAIKMLFKPHEAKYLFGKKVPFTPGLIPKRRDELADQMGKMVVGHLLTPDGIKRKLANEEFHQTLTLWTAKEAEKLISSSKTVTEFAADFGIKDLDDKAERWLKDLLGKKIAEKTAHYKDLSIKEALPETLLEKIQQSIPQAADFILKKGSDYFQSDEGKQRLRRMIDDFLAERGMLGGMVQMFLGNTSVFDKVQPEVLKFLRNGETKRLITSVLEKEWANIQNLNVGEAAEKFRLEDLADAAQEAILKEIGIKERLNAPVSQYLMPYSEWIQEDLIPKMTAKAVDYLHNNLDHMLGQMHLHDIVKEQVQSFSVSRLEEMVLGISRREFTMITYLGALLGGLIGALQGIIVLLMN
ncbi:uncharacterized membrane protein YheB (UPF0754 family) [Metabacillus sp. SLBN-84]